MGGVSSFGLYPRSGSARTVRRQPRLSSARQLSMLAAALQPMGHGGTDTRFPDAVQHAVVHR